MVFHCASRLQSILNSEASAHHCLLRWRRTRGRSSRGKEVIVIVMVLVVAVVKELEIVLVAGCQARASAPPVLRPS